MREIIGLYEGRELPGVKLQYKDFALWQCGFRNSAEIAKQERFWADTFKDGIPLLNLPVDFPRPPVRSRDGGNYFFCLDEKRTAAVKALVVASRATLYMFVLAAYAILLARHCAQEDVIVGSPVSGRSDDHVQDMVGLFINMVSMRNRPEGHKTFASFLGEVKQNCLDVFANQDYPFDSLVARFKLQGKPDRHPVFDAVFALFKVEQEEVWFSAPHGPGQISMGPYGIEVKAVQHDLLLSGLDYGREVKFSLEYSTALFKAATIEALAAHLLHIIDQVVADPAIRLKDIFLPHGFMAARTEIIEDEDEDFRFD